MTNEAQTEDHSVLKHFHLVAGNLLIQEGENVFHATQSAIVKSDSENFPVASLQKAQRNLQGIFFQKNPNPDIKVHDIVLTSINYLGYMSTEDFYRPDAQVQADMEAAQAAADAALAGGQPVINSEEDLKAALAEGGVSVQ